MKILGGFFALCVLLQLALIAVPRADGHLIGGDGLYYYAYLRSLCLDGNVNIQNEMQMHNAGLLAEPTPTPPASTGIQVDVIMRDIPQMTYAFAVGTSILWLPFFLLGHALVLLLNELGASFPVNGYSYLEEALVCLGSLLYGCTGLWLCYRLAREYVKDAVALWSTLIVTLGTSVFYYFIFEPSMSHAVSLFACALYFYTLWKTFAQPNTPHTSAQHTTIRTADLCLLGATVGLMTLVRWQNSVFLVALWPFLWSRWRSGVSSLTRTSQELFWIGLSAALIFIPQLLFWKVTLGTWLTIPQGSGFVDFLHPRIVEVLFTLQHGLLSWTPLVVLCLGGVVYFARRHTMGLAMMLSFLAMLYVNASVVADIGGGAAFGMRRFVNCTPFFILGLAYAGHSIRHRTALRSAMLFICMALLGFNGLFMVQYRLHFIDPIAPISLYEWGPGKIEMLSQGGTRVYERLR